jgi:hypothetical protein
VTGRGSRSATRRGQPAKRPDGCYEAEPVLDSELTGDWVLRFTGEDGRRTSINIGGWPLAAIHRPLAQALAVVCGPHGTVRSATSVEEYTAAVRRLVKFLDELPDGPTTLDALSVEHLEAYRRTRLTTAGPRRVNKDLRLLSTVFRSSESPNHVAEVGMWLDRPWPIGEPAGTENGYSDREFAAIMAAARAAVRAIVHRFASAKHLMHQYGKDPASLDHEQQQTARDLLSAASTGAVPTYRQGRRPDEHPNKENLPDKSRQLALASQLFLVERDMGPLLTLAVGLSGRNVETIKELIADCEVLEGRAVRVELTKRRRGPAGMFDSAHWEIGKPHLQLHTPGGLYLMVRELTQLGRSFSGTDSLWSIWTVNRGHRAAFGERLSRGHNAHYWQQHQLTLLGDDGEPLRLTMPRLKKTVDIRTTRATGGHLPSSTRSNSMSVLFANYLKGDESVRDWAGDVITAALEQAELDARATQARVLSVTNLEPAAREQQAATELGITIGQVDELLAGELDTVFTACEDIEHGPFDADRRCSASFLMCLSCENALISAHHIPRLKGLLSWLVRQWESLDVETWWTRHGLTWLALTQHIRPKFTPAEWDSAQEAVDVDSLLSLIDGPKE